jgi:hypothetical protein
MYLSRCRRAELVLNLRNVSLHQPLSSVTQLDTIIQRLDFVEMMLGSKDAFFAVVQHLTKFPDLEYLTATALVQVPKFNLATQVRDRNTEPIHCETISLAR